jgi:hypothetical protein
MSKMQVKNTKLLLYVIKYKFETLLRRTRKPVLSCMDDNVTRCKCATWRVTNATNTHWEYVIFIAFRRQKWLEKRASMLRYTYIDSLVLVYVLLSVLVL